MMKLGKSLLLRMVSRCHIGNTPQSILCLSVSSQVI